MSMTKKTDQMVVGKAQTHQAYPVKGTPTGLRARKEQQERFKEVMTRIHDESKMRAVADRREIDKQIRKLEKSGSPAARSTIIELQAKRKILTETIFETLGDHPLRVVQSLVASSKSGVTLDELFSDVNSTTLGLSVPARRHLASSMIAAFATLSDDVVELYNQWVTENQPRSGVPYNQLENGWIWRDYRDASEAHPLCVAAQAYLQQLEFYKQEYRNQYAIELARSYALEGLFEEQMVTDAYLVAAGRATDEDFDKKIESLVLNDPEPFAKAIFDVLNMAGLVRVNKKLLLRSDSGFTIDLGLKKITNEMIHWIEYRKGRVPMNKTVKILNDMLGVNDDDDEDDNVLVVDQQLVCIDGRYFYGREEVSPSLEHSESAMIVQSPREYRDDVSAVLDTFSIDSVQNLMVLKAYKLIEKIADSLSNGHADHLQSAMSLMLNRKDHGKYPYLLGLWCIGGTGKSSFLKLATRASNEHNSVTTPPEELVRDRQSQMNLRDAGAYIIPEMPQIISSTVSDFLKKLASSDKIGGRELNSRQQIEFRANLLVAFATNYSYRTDRSYMEKSSLRRRVLPYRGRHVKLEDLLTREELDMYFNEPALMEAAMLIWQIIGMQILEEKYSNGLQSQDWMQENINEYLGDINQVDNVTKKGTDDDRLSLDGKVLSTVATRVQNFNRVNGLGGRLSDSSIAKAIENSTEYELVREELPVNEDTIAPEELEYYREMKDTRDAHWLNRKTTVTVVRLKDEALKKFTPDRLEHYPELLSRYNELMTVGA